MRTMRVATISIPKRSDPEAGIREALEHLELAAEADPDIVVFPEACFNSWQTPEPVPGPLTQIFAERALALATHIVFPMIRQAAEGMYNVAVLIDPKGEIVGEYRKMFPVDTELERGILPGTTTPVFEIPQGRIGMAICFDIHFPEVIEGLVAGGAEVVFFVSAFEGGRLLESWALEHGVYIVSAHRGGLGAFVDKSGRLLQKGDPRFQPVVVRDLNMERDVFHLNYNWEKVREIVRRYQRAVHVEVFRPEAFFVLEVRSPDLSLAQLIEEYELETFRDYIKRCKDLCDGARGAGRAGG